jgi:hypothetical protein
MLDDIKSEQLRNGKVSDQSDIVAKMAEQWPIIDALVGGTPAMRKWGKKFLPQFPAEDNDSYAERLSTAVLFNAFGRTSSVFAAKPFARPIRYDGVAPGIDSYIDNIDLQGTDFHAFCGQTMLACMRYGLHGVMVDYPTAGGVRTIAEERAAGIRPYWTQYPCSSILGWRSELSASGSFLTQLRLMETVRESAGPWLQTTVQQVRVLTPGHWEIWREEKTEKGSEWVKVDEGDTTLKVIPFVFFYGLREGFGIGRPPLLDLAHMNVEHWQSRSDQQTILHVARVPILFAKGFSEDAPIFVGSKSVTKTPEENADMKYVEHSGAAIEAGRQDIQDLEDRMRQAGAELLVKRASIQTATQIQSEDESGRSTLHKIAEEFEDSLELCLQITGQWLGEETEPEVELFKDFSSANLTERIGDLLLRAGDSNHISSETVFNELKRLDVVHPDLTWADESTRLAGQRKLEAEHEARVNKATASAE